MAIEVDEDVWRAALKLAATVHLYEHELMEKYSEDWNMEILYRMRMFYSSLHAAGERGYVKDESCKSD